MRTNNFRFGFFAACAVVAGGLTATTVDAQQQGGGSAARSGQQQASTYYYTDLHCSGAIEDVSSYGLEIVSGEDEAYRRVFATGDMIYINGGVEQGIRVGQEFAVVRPRGRFRGAYTNKTNSLGVYTQEVGKLRVVKVNTGNSLAEVEASCEVLQFGDYIRPIPTRTQPSNPTPQTNLDRYADASGKQQGRIVLARGGRELLATNDVVHIDLGAEDGVKVNDTLSVRRRVEGRSVTNFRDDNVAVSASGGFESNAFRGGPFAVDARRVTKPDNRPSGPTTNFPDVKRRRPALPTQLIGEIVITSVQQRTATAIITRVNTELHPGDYVEMQ